MKRRVKLHVMLLALRLVAAYVLAPGTQAISSGNGVSSGNVSQQPKTAPAALPKALNESLQSKGSPNYRLTNGLKILLFPDPTKQTITTEYDLPWSAPRLRIMARPAWPTCWSICFQGHA